jgi:hypothetical protein
MIVLDVNLYHFRFKKFSDSVKTASTVWYTCRKDRQVHLVEKKALPCCFVVSCLQTGLVDGESNGVTSCSMIPWIWLWWSYSWSELTHYAKRAIERLQTVLLAFPSQSR